MLAKCHTECYHGPTHTHFSPDVVTEAGPGMYDIDPEDPVAVYFDFDDEELNQSIKAKAGKEIAKRAAKLAQMKKNQK